MWFESAVYGSPLHEDDGRATRYERRNPTAVSENTLPLVTLAPSPCHSRPSPSSLSRSGSPCGSNPRFMDPRCTRMTIEPPLRDDDGRVPLHEDDDRATNNAIRQQPVTSS